MKKLHTILTIFALCFYAAACGQENPVRWKGAVEDNGGGRYTLVMTAEIADGWHMYDLGPYEGGPNATTIRFVAGDGVETDGKLVQKTESKRVFDKMFEMQIGYFEHRAVFEQAVTLSAPSAVVKAR